MKHKYLVDLFCLLIIFAITYWMVPFIFFQQDEWRVFGLMIAQGIGLAVANFGSSSFHLVPVNLSLAYLIFELFHLNYVVYNLIGLVFHFTNGVLVYLIASKILQKRILALLSGILFLTSSVSSQLVMWPVVSISTLSLMFALLAWVVLLKESSRVRFLDGFLAAVFMVLALLTVEYALGLLVFIPATYLLLKRKIAWKKKAIFLFPIIFFSFSYVALRVVSLLFKDTNTTKVIETTPLLIIDRLLSMPIRYLAQALVPEGILVSIAYLFTKNPLKAETIVFSTLTVGGGILIFTVVAYFLYLAWKYRILNYWPIIIMILLFLLASSAPFILLPGEEGGFSIFPPRYLYFGMVGMALLLGVILEISFACFNRPLKMILLVTVLLIVVVGIKENWRRESVLIETGKARENILKTMKESYPDLPQKVIFYTDSDSSYYYQEGKILPFQSGFGQTLLVWYWQENFSKDFYEDKFLWEIESQDYREVAGRGFGYFREFDLLQKTVKKYNISPDSVIAFRWVGQPQTLTDITDEVRDKLQRL